MASFCLQQVKVGQGLLWEARRRKGKGPLGLREGVSEKGEGLSKKIVVNTGLLCVVQKTAKHNHLQ